MNVKWCISKVPQYIKYLGFLLSSNNFDHICIRFCIFSSVKTPCGYTNKHRHYRMLSMNKHFLIGKSCSMYHKLPEVNHFFIQYYFILKKRFMLYSIFKGFIGHIDVCYVIVIPWVVRLYVEIIHEL